MIGKIVQGKSFRGLLNYLHNKEFAQQIGGNMVGETPRELAAEFRVARELNLRLKKAVCHVSLSLPKHEHLEDDCWNAIAQDYIVGMGYEGCQYVVYRHHDQDHDHIHIGLCRIRLTDGATVSDSWEKRRAETLICTLEKQYQLESVQSSWEKTEAAPTTGEMRRFERTGELPIRVRLQAQIDQAAEGSSSIAQLIHQLKDQGIDIHLRIRSQRITGISYRLDGIAFSGSKLGRAYTFPGLQKYKGLRYDHPTEFEATCQAAGRSSQSSELGIDATIVAEFERLAESFKPAIASPGRRPERDQAIPDLPPAVAPRTLGNRSTFGQPGSQPGAGQPQSIRNASTGAASNADRPQPVRAIDPPQPRDGDDAPGTRSLQERTDHREAESGSDQPIVARLQPILPDAARATDQPGRQDRTTIGNTHQPHRESAAGDAQSIGVSPEAVSERRISDLSRHSGDVDLFEHVGVGDRLDADSDPAACQPEPHSSNRQQQRDPSTTTGAGAAANDGAVGHSTAEEVNEEQQLWQRYSQGIQASNTVKLNSLVARRAFEDGRSVQEITQMLHHSPFVREMMQKGRSPDKIEAYIHQTVHQACQKQQEKKLVRGKERSLELN
ncbi:relaxase/mobilization nuclease domain-containing protein [Phormidesmis sp. 146-12]